VVRADAEKDWPRPDDILLYDQSPNGALAALLKNMFNESVRALF
jgi:hypothetical protein